MTMRSESEETADSQPPCWSEPEIEPGIRVYPESGSSLTQQRNRDFVKMGLTISSLFSRFFGKKQMRILMGESALCPETPRPRPLDPDPQTPRPRPPDPQTPRPRPSAAHVQIYETITTSTGDRS
ncbi:hypothetical protein EYF80_067230 [Liparis tanakae]|uniref:Uncharacterized protein n=1 Tax=Liparis tanakae TaxID=230148 RepID=A0A4Z2E1K5_9TELE|nr:hypothetical protein EYF80_067230 [Liparis tanakae]